jgi:hypothetical protein
MRIEHQSGGIIHTRGGDPEIERRFAEWLPALPAAFIPQIAVRCPFCQATSGALYAAGEERGIPVAYHERGPFPECEEWKGNELLEFLEMARLRMSD